MTANQILHYGWLKIIMKNKTAFFLYKLRITSSVLDTIRIRKRGSHCMKLTRRRGNTFKGIYYDAFKGTFY